MRDPAHSVFDAEGRGTDEEGAAKRRVLVEAQRGNRDARESPVSEVVVAPDHRGGESQILDVDAAGLAAVEGVQHIENADGVGAPPDDDLSADLDVEVFEQFAVDVDLGEVDLPFVLVEHLLAEIVAASDGVDGITEAIAGDAHLEVLGEVEVELQVQAIAQPRDARVARARARVVRQVVDGGGELVAAVEVEEGLRIGIGGGVWTLGSAVHLELLGNLVLEAPEDVLEVVLRRRPRSEGEPEREERNGESPRSGKHRGVRGPFRAGAW